MSSTKFVFFGSMGKTRWPPWPLIALSPNSGHAVLHVVFLTSFHCDVTTAQQLDGPFDCDIIMKKSANRCDVGPLAKGQLAETFSTSPLKPLNRIQQYLTGRNISTSSTKFVFFGPIRKTRWPPWPLIGGDIFDFSSETAERNLTKLYRKQDHNVLYQVCVFQAIQKNKMAALASDWLRHFPLPL